MVDNKTIHSIGYDPKADPYEDFLRSIGVDRELVKLIASNDYNGFIRELRSTLSNKNEDYKLTAEDVEVVSSWTEDDFNALKDEMNKMKSTFEDIQKTEKTTKEDSEWRPDFRVILNGNFDKMDKTQLSDEAKVAFNVHGLPDIMYDIYIDTKNGKALPIYYDYDTKNDNFFAFSTFLEKFKGILNIPEMNHKVPLILFDRTLIGIDTDVNLTPIIQMKVALEIQKNPFFYFRECARVYDKTTGKNVRYQMTIATYTYFWLFCQCINTYNERPRQTGKTFDIGGTGGMEWGVGSRNSLLLVVHFKSDEAGKNRRAMVESVNRLPKFLKFHIIKKRVKKGKDVWEEGPENPIPTEKGKNYMNDRFNNNLKITAVGSTETTAQQVGRGDSVKFGFVDELNYIKNATTVLTALQFAHGTAKLLAEKAGERYGLHFSSTAGELNTKNGQAMYKLTQEDMCKFDPKLFGYNYQDLVTYLKKNSDKNFFSISYQYNEMGYGESWIENAISLSTNREEFQKDILSVWQAVDVNALFGVAALTRINQICKDTLRVSFMYEKYNKFEYYPKRADIEFAEYIKQFNAISIGVDIALGTSGDYTVMRCIDLETAKPVFLYRENTLNAFDFGILIVDFLRYLKKIHPDLLIVVNPESDGPGQVIIPMLTKEKDIEPMIYRSLEYYNKQMKNVLIKATTKHIDSNSYIKYGTAMTAHRSTLTNVLLFDLVDKYPYIFNNEDAFKELTTLKRKTSGKIEHANGFHDDIVMATLHASALIFLPKFRESLERFFHFKVDFRKIESLPLDSHIVSYSQLEGYNDIEGKLSWDIITKIDPQTKLEYDELVMTKITNGRQVKLSMEEIQEELRTNEKLMNDPRIRMMRLRTFNISAQILPQETASAEKMALDELSFNRSSDYQRQQQKYQTNRHTQTVSGFNQSNISGNDLSRDNTRKSGDYFKRNANNYKASLI